MSDERTYRLAKGYRVFVGLFLLVFVSGISSLIIGVIGEDQPGALVFLIWVLFVMTLFIYQVARGVTSITLQEDSITFKSLLRTSRIPIGEIVAIGTDWWDLNRTVPFVRHIGGKIRLLGPFEGFYDLITQLKQRN